MTPGTWWERRGDCARVLLEETFLHGMGPMKGVETRLTAALRDVLARPGSMVRAVVAYLVGVEMGMLEEGARAVACGIEYLHTASLVFDDLPAMDDARSRRGAPCLHVTHGEPVAVLAALALVNRGYAMLWQGLRHAAPSRQAEAAEWIDARLGVHGVTGGQAYDLSGWRDGQTAAAEREVAARKTGDLLRLTVVLPAILGRGTRREIERLDRLALLRGLAYQAADDLKDVLGNENDSGKTTGRDEALGRPNLVVAEGLGPALRRFQRLSQTADRIAASLPGGADRWGMLRALEVGTPDTLKVSAVV